MSHSVTFDEETGLVEVSYHGKVGVFAIREGASEAARIAREHDCFRILVDSRETKLSLSTMDIYDLPKTFSMVLSKLGLDIRRFKRALVVSSDIEDFHFVETVLRNRGQQAKLFRNIDEARAWLSGT